MKVDNIFKPDLFNAFANCEKKELFNPTKIKADHVENFFVSFPRKSEDSCRLKFLACDIAHAEDMKMGMNCKDYGDTYFRPHDNNGREYKTIKWSCWSEKSDEQIGKYDGDFKAKLIKEVADEEGHLDAEELKEIWTLKDDPNIPSRHTPFTHFLGTKTSLENSKFDIGVRTRLGECKDVIYKKGLAANESKYPDSWEKIRNFRFFIKENGKCHFESLTKDDYARTSDFFKTHYSIEKLEDGAKWALICNKNLADKFECTGLDANHQHLEYLENGPTKLVRDIKENDTPLLLHSYLEHVNEIGLNVLSSEKVIETAAQQLLV